MIVDTSLPRASSVAGSSCATLPRPPVLAKGFTSALANTILSGLRCWEPGDTACAQAAPGRRVNAAATHNVRFLMRWSYSATPVPLATPLRPTGEPSVGGHGRPRAVRLGL